jgi:hypothetical protein
LLKKIQSYFKVGKIYIRIREGRISAIYSEYPILTQRIDFNFFCSIINLMNKKEHFNMKGILDIISIKACMNKGLPEELKKVFPSVIFTKRQ